MADLEIQDIAPEDPGDGTSSPIRKGRSAFKNLRRELTEDELASPAIQRMLIDEIERLEEENIDLKEAQNLYHEADKRSAVLEEKLKDRLGQEIMYGSCLAVGAAAMGYAPAIWGPGRLTGLIFIALGAILIIAVIISRSKALKQ